MSEKPIHPQAARLYEAAIAGGHIPQDATQADLARLINTSSQVIHNWEKRGPSKSALIDIQATLGINATWILTGAGPMYVEAITSGSSQWPFSRIDIRRIQRLVAEDRAYIEGKLEAAIEAVEAQIAANKSNTHSRAA